MLSHGQTVTFRPHSVLHLWKAEHLRIPKFRLKVNFRHPMKRFYDTSGMIFFTILKPCLRLNLIKLNQNKCILKGSRKGDYREAYARSSGGFASVRRDRTAGRQLTISADQPASPGTAEQLTNGVEFKAV